MPSKPTDPKALTITMTEDGTAALSGINYQDLRSILTAASLYNYEAKEKIEPMKEGDNFNDVRHENNVENVRWRRWQRALLDILNGHMAEAIRPGYADGKPSADRAHRDYLRALKTLDADVLEMEAEAAKAPKPQPDPLAEVSEDLRVAVARAQNALAKLARMKR